MRSRSKRTWDNLEQKIELTRRGISARKYGKERRAQMGGRYTVSDEAFKAVVVPYWKNYGIKVKKFWWELFTEKDQLLNPRYIPDDLYNTKILPYFNNMSFRRSSDDKCSYDFLFASLKRPRTIVKNSAGVYYDAEGKIISEEEAIALCLLESDEFLFKPAIDTGHGRGIQFMDPETTKRKDIEAVIHRLKANFIVQASLKQHAQLALLNASSVNTIRIISFLFQGSVYISSAILRVGAKGAKIDNFSAGGYACPIKEGGQLWDKALTRESEWVPATNEGVLFSSVRVPNFDQVVDIIKKEHLRLAHFKIIGWDFAIDEEGDPVFIEHNVNAGQNQVTCGPTFGPLTEAVLDDVFFEKSLRYAQN